MMFDGVKDIVTGCKLFLSSTAFCNQLMVILPMQNPSHRKYHQGNLRSTSGVSRKEMFTFEYIGFIVEKCLAVMMYFKPVILTTSRFPNMTLPKGTNEIF